MAIDDANAKGVVIGGKKVHFELISEDDQARSQDGDHRRAKAGGQQCERRDRPSQLGHHDSCCQKYTAITAFRRFRLLQRRSLTPARDSGPRSA